MDLTLCGVTAFEYYRVPPQVLGCYPMFPGTVDDPGHRKLANAPVICDLLGKPLHRIVDSQSQRGASKLYVSHFYKGGLPGLCYETHHGFKVTSPEATLLTMASTCSREQVLMALYEMTGTFAVFNPCERAEAVLDQGRYHDSLFASAAWRRVDNVDGRGTSLWKRPPIISRRDLSDYCGRADRVHGIKSLRWAAAHVTGETASPFEAQASMLLGLPRRCGGEGLEIRNNQRIQLSADARRIYPYDSCYADILIEGEGDNAGVIVECQGRSVHASEAAGISDSNRATALAGMGYEVILLTHEQIRDARSFQVVLDIIARKTGKPRRDKTDLELRAEENLREAVFTDWSLLGR